jgi:hypothetical protein
VSDDLDDVIVTVQDLAVLGYCRKGSRHFFAQQGLDWGHFLDNGIPASTLKATNDVMADALIEQAKRRVAEGE